MAPKLSLHLLLCAALVFASCGGGDSAGGEAGRGGGGSLGAGGSAGGGASGGGGHGGGPGTGGGSGRGGGGGDEGQDGPRVLKVAPRSGATDVSLDTPVLLTFSEMMDHGPTEAATEILVNGAPVGWTAEWLEPSFMLRLHLLELLPPGAEVEIVVSTAAKDEQGRALATPFSSSFHVKGGGEFPWGEWDSMRWDKHSWR